MTAYFIRRLLHALPLLLGVNILTFVLFFVVNSPDDIARMQLGQKRVGPDIIREWKHERGYDLPLLWNSDAAGAARATDTIFYQKSVGLFLFRFGRSDQGRDIAADIRQRMWPSLAIAAPSLLFGVMVNISLALLVVLFRLTYLEFWGVALCVGLMSVSSLFYIIGGQYLFGKMLQLVPISGYDGGRDAW
ncbi:MAG: ABC transporter permease, partial [Gammaproteobacteria bacterium]|nr:ABC transporter permease [Gammaproteobacteria bacterium]